MSKIIFSRDLGRHPLHYFTLLSLELIGLWGLLWFNYDRAMQFSVLLAMAAAYVVWGLMHHKEHHDLGLHIVVEYVLIAVLAVLLVGFQILRT